MTLEKIKSGKIIRASQDRNGELMSLLAAICIIAMKISFILIYQSEFRNL